MRDAARIALVAAPFLSPLVGGPSNDAWQLMVSWCCAALLALIGPAGAPRRRVAGLLLLAGAAVGLGSADARRWLPALVALGAAGLAAGAGTGMARTGGRVLAVGLLSAGLVNALLGLLQYYGHAGWLVPWTTAPELGQAYGNLRQRNQFATLMNMALVAALWLHAAARGRTRVAWGAGLALLVVALAASTLAHGPAAAAGRCRHRRLHRPARASGAGRCRPPPAAACRAAFPRRAVCARFVAAAHAGRRRAGGHAEPPARGSARGPQPAAAVAQRAGAGLGASVARLGLGRAELRALHAPVFGAALRGDPRQRAQPAASPGGRTRRSGLARPVRRLRGAGALGAAVGASAIRCGSWAGACSA